MSHHPERRRSGGMRRDRERDPAREEKARTGEERGLQPSVAPNNAFETGAGEINTGFDSPPVTSQYFGAPPFPEPDFPVAYDSPEHALEQRERRRPGRGRRRR